MSLIVVDASITADWLLGDEFDPRATTALGRLRRDGAIVPQLWHYEIRNVLLVAERRGRVLEGGTKERLDSLMGLPITTDQDAHLEAAFNLAREHLLSFYDALYLELAKRREAEIATLDRELARAARAEGLELTSA